MAPPAANNRGYFSDPWYDEPSARAAPHTELHARVVDDALFLPVAHHLNPGATSRHVQGFVQAQSRFPDRTPIRMG